MKKAICILMYLLSALTLLYPAAILTSAFGGYIFRLIGAFVFPVIIAILSMCIVILDIICKRTGENKVMRITLPIVTPFSLLNAIFFILKCPQIHVIICVFISVVCCFILTIKYNNRLSLILSAIMIIPISFIIAVRCVFGNLVENTVVKTIESPNGEYYAEVIDSNQGALGGDTFVDIYKNGINAVVFRTEKKTQRVYFGDWGEYKNMQIHWKDDNCLVINSVDYEIE